jgi:stearoyl-CoA desaturase (delta-9 desaturase)
MLGYPKKISLSLPAGVSFQGVSFHRIDWINLLTVASFHTIALLAPIPWFFNWSSVGVMVVGIFVFGYLGINLFYHRLLTHRGLKLPKWLEHTLLIFAICCLQDTPAKWVGAHRWHHVHSDKRDDPHSPLAGFLWGNMGWIFLKNDNLDRLKIYTLLSKDILRDRFYKKFETTARYPLIILSSWLLFLS